MTAVAAMLVTALMAVAAPPPPNVVLIVTDDETLRDMAVMPLTRAAIGGQGVTFTDYRASYPLCCPARASILTGQYAHNHHVLGNIAPDGGIGQLDQRHTLPVALSHRPGRRYVTAHVGKYLNGYGHGEHRGIPPGWSNWHGSLVTYRMYGYVLNENGNVHQFGDVHREEPRYYQTTVYRKIATGFIRRRAQADDGRPFLLSVAFLAPHAEKYDRQGLPAPSVRPAPRDSGTFADRPLPRDAAFDETDMADKPRWLRRARAQPMTPGRIRAITRRYHAREESLLAVDRAVESIVNTLRDTGQLRRTYVVFTSDNGFMEGQHRVRNGKLVPYEPATTLPLLVRGPGIPAGRVSREPALDVDLAPTILDMADAPHGWTIDGRSLLPFAQRPGRRPTLRPRLQEIGPQENTRGDLNQEGGRLGRGEVLPVPRYRGVSTVRYRYLRYGNGEEELYDLQRDPAELDNRIRDPRYRAARRALRRQLERLRNCAGPECRKRIAAIPGPGG